MKKLMVANTPFQKGGKGNTIGITRVNTNNKVTIIIGNSNQSSTLFSRAVMRGNDFIKIVYHRPVLNLPQLHIN